MTLSSYPLGYIRGSKTANASENGWKLEPFFSVGGRHMEPLWKIVLKLLSKISYMIQQFLPRNLLKRTANKIYRMPLVST
jgi:hypothetical protein